MTVRVSRLQTAFVALLAWGIPTAAAAQADVSELTGLLPDDPSVRTATLENGVRYYVRANGKPENRAELYLVVNAGSVLEEEDQRGLAHLVEHMAFNGTANFEKQELVDYLESVGMRFGPNVNAYTSFDETVYTLTVPTDDPEIVQTAMQILEDWAHQVSFEPEEVDKERGVVIEEWRRGRGARARMFDEQLPVLLHGSRYADRLPIGTVEVLESFEHETIVRYYRDWYRPDLMAVVAVGDFDEDWVIALIESHFGRIAMPDEPRSRTYADVPGHEETLYAIASDPEATNSQVALLWKYAPPEEGTVEAYRQSLVEQLYNGMFNARLFELGQSAEAPYAFAGSGIARFVRTSEFYQLFALVEDGRIPTGFETLMTEAERVQRHGFTESELERQKVEMLRGMLSGRWLSDENRVILINSPEKPGLEIPTAAELTTIFQSVTRAEVAPYDDGSTDAPLVAEVPSGAPIAVVDEVPEIGVTFWELTNGVRVFLKPTDFEDDQVLLQAYSPGGHSLAPDEDFQSASQAAGLVGQAGVGDFDLVSLGKKLAGEAVEIRPVIGSLTEGMTGQASPQDLETLFQLVYLYFTRPRKDETAFESFQVRVRAVLENRSASPQAAFTDTLNAILTQHHPRTRPPSVELLSEIDLDVAYEFYRDRFADASDFTFVLVGAFDPVQVQPLVEAYLGGLPSIDREETWRDVGIEAPGGVIERVVERGLEPKSQTRIVFTGPAEWSASNSAALSALGDVLSIKLRERLREDLGGTYTVSARGGISRAPREEYDFTISFGADPDRLEDLVDVVWEEVEKIQRDGPTPEDIVKVREIQRRAKETSLERNNWWVGRIVRADRFGDDLQDIPSFELIDAITAEMVQEAASRYLTRDSYVRVSLYPQETIP
jgi:zinc protease